MTDATPRLWIASELYYPEEVSTGHFVTGIAEDMSDVFCVHAICSQPSYSRRGQLAPRDEIRNGVRIHRVTPPLFDKNVLPLRILTSILVTGAIGVALLRRARPGDHVLVVTNPPMLPYVVAAVCRLRHTDYTVLVHDVYPDVLTAVGMVRRGGFVERVVSRAVRWLYDGAQRVVVLGRDMARNVGARMRTPSRLEIIPNWGDDNLIVATPLRSAGPFVVQYLGNMGRTHDIETLIKAAEYTRADGIHWMFVGDGAKRHLIEAALTSTRNGNITLQGRVPANVLSSCLGEGHVSVISFVGGMAGISVPSRVYNAMCAARPIVLVADTASEVAHLVREHGIGWVVEPGDALSLSQVIRELAADRGRVEAAGHAARALAEACFTRQAVTDRFRRMFTEVVAERGV